jgi:hypothetical protein
MKEYVLNENDIEFLKKSLYSSHYWKDPNLPEESIMECYKVCNHDDGFFCEHRLEWLINFIENKEIKTRKVKLEKIKEL